MSESSHTPRCCEEKRTLRFSLDVRPLQMSSRYQGTGVYCYNLIRSLMRVDLQNRYLLFQKHRRMWQELPLPPNFRTLPVQRTFDQDQRWMPLLDQILTPLDLLRIRPDLHHAFSIHYDCAWLPCPLVLSILDVIPLVFPEHYLQSGIRHRLLYRLARRANHILTLSEHSRRDIHRYLRIPLEKITVTHAAADPMFHPLLNLPETTEVLRKYGVERPYLLFVGGFTKKDPRKQISQLIEAYHALRTEGFDRFRLVLAGKLGDYSDILKREMVFSGSQQGVVFTGYVEDADLPHLYRAASCFVFPSLYEGFGLPPLEAISCGTPTIAYRNSSIPEVLGDAAILLDGRDTRDLVAAMKAVLTQPGMADELREKGLRQARKFTWEACARKTLGVYEEVASRSRDRKA